VCSPERGKRSGVFVVTAGEQYEHRLAAVLAGSETAFKFVHAFHESANLFHGFESFRTDHRTLVRTNERLARGKVLFDGIQTDCELRQNVNELSEVGDVVLDPFEPGQIGFEVLGYNLADFEFEYGHAGIPYLLLE